MMPLPKLYAYKGQLGLESDEDRNRFLVTCDGGRGDRSYAYEVRLAEMLAAAWNMHDDLVETLQHAVDCSERDDYGRWVVAALAILDRAKAVATVWGDLDLAS